MAATELLHQLGCCSPNQISRRIAAFAVLALALLPLSASSQEESNDEDDPKRSSEGHLFAPRDHVEEIQIIGETLENERLDEAASVTSFSAADLKTLRVQNISDLADFTVNLEINTRSAASNPTLFIRGIGLKDYNANAASAVSVYQDGININSPAIQLGQLFDTESVDVRRGPQGSTDGRNATAGAILLRSNLPTDEFSATGSATYGNYSAIELEGAVNVPLVEDVLFSRVAFVMNLRDGTTRNRCADWNPQTIFPDQPGRQGLVDSFLVTDQTLLAEYQKDVAAGNTKTLSEDRYDIFSSQSLSRQNQINQAGTGAQAKSLQIDSVCILRGPGSVVTPLGEMQGGIPAGTFIPDNVPQLADFQGLDRNLNNIDNWATRGLLRYEPIEESSWIFNGHGGQSRGGSTHLSMLGANAKGEGGFFEALEEGFSERSAADLAGFEGTQNVNGLDASFAFPGRGGDDPFTGYYNRDGTESLDSYGGSLTGTYELDEVLITSLTGYEWYDRQIEDEGDANPLDIFPAEWSDNAWQFSQEIRADGEGEDYGWTLGAFFLHERLTAGNLFPDTRQFELIQDFDQKLYSAAPYVSARYAFTEELSAEGGVRYNFERKKFTLGSSARGTTSGVQTQEIPEQTVEKTWTEPTGDLTLTYSPQWGWLDGSPFEVLNFFSRYAHGFKGGHFNASLAIRNGIAEQTVEPVEPEFIDAIELGFKSSLFDDRLFVKGQVFRYWYKDLQVFDIENAAGELPIQQLLNAPKARVWGAELEVKAQPLEGLTLEVAGAWLDSRFVEFRVKKATSIGPRGEPFEEIFNYDGNRTIAAPRWSLSGMAQYEIPLFGWGYLIPNYNFNYRTKVYLDPQQLDPISQPAYWLHNARVSYLTEDERIEVSVWMNNIFDQIYKDDVFDLSREFDTILEVYGDPRTFGATVSFTW